MRPLARLTIALPLLLATACGGTTAPVPPSPAEAARVTTADEPARVPMSRYVLGAWRVDVEGTLKIRQPGLAGHMRDREDLAEMATVALAFRDCETRPVRLSDGAVGPKTAISLEDRPFDDAWLRVVGEDTTAHLRRDGDDGAVILDDGEAATRFLRVEGVDPRWDDPGVELFPDAEEAPEDEDAPDASGGALDDEAEG
ncbi:MAG: hypothetical protein EP329_08125 [Deltaproteobacteria bacterium]|nr:MAG: hypothetical protein EP329_08125 [Deltaproteobacteria bacterium]